MPTTTTTTTADSVLAAIADKPGSSAAQLAQATSLGRSTVTKTLAALEKDGRACRTTGKRDGARRAADTWTLPTTPATTDSTSTTPHHPRNAPDQRPGSSTRKRLRKGELNGLVLDHLTEHGQPMTASALGKAIGRSGGAVANALARMEATGQVTRVTDKPRTYQPTPG